MARYATPIARTLLRRPVISFGAALLVGLVSVVFASKLAFDTRFSALLPEHTPELIEVNRLGENALPEAYLALSESLIGGYDEGFIDFLIPPLDEDHVS